MVKIKTFLIPSLAPEVGRRLVVVPPALARPDNKLSIIVIMMLILDFDF